MQMTVVSTGSKGNCILLEHERRIIILDCGVPIKDIMEAVKFNTINIDACLVSHSHCDHSSSAKKLTEMFIEVVMPKQTAFDLNIPENSATLHLIDTSDLYQQFTFGDWFVKGFELEHDVYNVGYIIYNRMAMQKIVYISDTGFIRHVIPDADILIVEANFIDDLLTENEDNNEQLIRIKKSHMGLSRLCSYVNKISKHWLKHIVLVHLSEKNADEQTMADEVAKVTSVHTIIAKDGMKVSLDKERGY